MKKIILVIVLETPIFFAQSQDSSYSSCCHYLNEINGIKVLESDSLNNIIFKRLKKKKIKENTTEDYPYVYFLNAKGAEYLKIYSSPGNGYGQFFEVGKVSSNLNLTRSIGSLTFKNFYSNDSLTIGLSEQKVWKHIPLEKFRVFVHKGILYFVYEEGQYQGNNPSSPNTITFLKFEKGKLISYGFGYGFPLFNPVFPP